MLEVNCLGSMCLITMKRKHHHTLSKQHILVCSGIHANTEKSSKTYKLQRKGIRTATWTWSPRFEKQMRGCLFIDGDSPMDDGPVLMITSQIYGRRRKDVKNGWMGDVTHFLFPLRLDVLDRSNDLSITFLSWNPYSQFWNPVRKPGLTGEKV